MSVFFCDRERPKEAEGKKTHHRTIYISSVHMGFLKIGKATIQIATIYGSLLSEGPIEFIERIPFATESGSDSRFRSPPGRSCCDHPKFTRHIGLQIHFDCWQICFKGQKIVGMLQSIKSSDLFDRVLLDAEKRSLNSNCRNHFPRLHIQPFFLSHM